MSRVPFSQLYWKCLSPEERRIFKELFNTVVSSPIGEALKLRQYTKEDQENLGQVVLIDQRLELGKKNKLYNGSENFKNVLLPISLKEWYKSIVSENRDSRGEIYPDLLSPAPGLEETYSMGAMDLLISAVPLFEVRSYGTTSFGNVDKVVKLVYDESKWFFEDLK